MQCPRCKVEVLDSVSVCPRCGHDLAIYKSLIEMKNEILNLGNDAELLCRRIDAIRGCLNKARSTYEHSISEEKPFFREETLHPDSRNVEIPATDGKPEPPKPAYERFAEEQTEQAPFPFPPPPPPKMNITGRYRTDNLPISEIALGQKWLLIAGILTTVLAVGWFLKYSFDRNWVTPSGRVALSYFCGILFLGGGEFFRRRNFERFGLYLIGGGIATLYFSTFAAFRIYDLIPQIPAFGLMILVTVTAGVLSLVYNTKWLSVLGLIGGFLTPVVLSTGQNDQIALMIYMAILNVCILYIAFHRQWQLLNYLGFAFTWMLFTGWFTHYYEIGALLQTFIFLNIFFLIYAAIPFAYHLVHEDKKDLIGIGMSVLNSSISFGYAYMMIAERFSVEYVSLISFSYSVIYLLMARRIYQQYRKQVEAFIMLITIALVFLFITVPLLFSGEWITFFWLLQASCLIWASLRMQNRLLYRASTAVLLFTIVKFFVYDYEFLFSLYIGGIYFFEPYTYKGLERFITEAVVLFSAFAAARLVQQGRGGMRLIADVDDETPWFWAGFGLILFAVLNVEVSGFFYEYASQARFASISVLWTLFSIGLILLGFMKNKPIVRHCAIGLFAVTMLKVFFMDMENVTTPWRIISFMVLGIMLIGASYLYYRFRDRIAETGEDHIP